jgi:hypothetical protein
MIATYASAALICAASLLVGRAVLGFGGSDGAGPRDWLGPAIGFGALVTVAGFLARAPGHATAAAIGIVVLLLAAGALLWWRGERPARPPWLGLLVAALVVAVLSIPFAVSGRWGLLGVGFNNDLGLHLAWAEWLRNGLGPAPEAGYPLGPHAVATTLAALPGIGLGQAFVGEIFAIGILTALAALAALEDLGAGRRVAAALFVAISYLGASYFAQGAFKETAEALFVLALALWLHDLDLDRRRADMSRQSAHIGPSAVGWTVLAVAFGAGAAYSSLLVLRDAPVGPPGHGSELQAFVPQIAGQPVLYAGQDRYAAYELIGADTHVPLVEFPDSEVAPSPEKPFDTGNAYSPIDFDSFSRATLDRFPYAITGRAAWNSEAPANFRRVAATPSYVLWKRTGPTPQNRHVLLEGTEPAAHADCAAPELRILTANAGTASLFPGAVVGFKRRWSPSPTLETGGSASQVLRLPAGEWSLSVQYFSPFELTLTAPGLDRPLPAALDGQRPNTISLANEGQPWPAGTVISRGGKVRFEISAADANWLQGLTGYTGKATLGELVAVPARPHRIVPLAAACGGWLDWYEAGEAP